MNLAALQDPGCLGLSSIALVSRKPFWSEDDLPFDVYGAGVLRVVPHGGFHKQLLATTSDDLAVMPDCPDAPGWLVPEAIVARWMAEHISNEQMDDILLSHPLYTHRVNPDAKGHSRGGRGRLVHWSVGVPTQAHIQGPEFLPQNRDAPAVNRQRNAYAAACVELVARLQEEFDVLEIECSFAYAS